MSFLQLSGLDLRRRDREGIFFRIGKTTGGSAGSQQQSPPAQEKKIEIKPRSLTGGNREKMSLWLPFRGSP